MAEVLRRHGAELQARARSEAGDLPALEMLAYLQVSVGDQAALKASDELGWRRYRVAKFAKSRLIGALSDEQEWNAWTSQAHAN